MSTLTFIAIFAGGLVSLAAAFAAYSAAQLRAIGTEEWLRKHGPRIQGAEAGLRDTTDFHATEPTVEDYELPRAELQRMARGFLQSGGERAGAHGIYQSRDNLLVGTPWTRVSTAPVMVGWENYSPSMVGAGSTSRSEELRRMDDVIQHAVQSLKVARTDAESEAVIQDLEVRLQALIERSARSLKAAQPVFGGGLGEPLARVELGKAPKPGRR